VNRFSVLILAAAALCACGGRPVSQVNVLHRVHNAMSQDALTVNMGALGRSRQWGSASMGDDKHGMKVEIQLDNAPHGAAEPAYIAHSGCTPPARDRWRRLQPVVNGKSASFVPGVDIGRIKKGRYAVVVLGPRSGQPVSCGNFQI
jgi:hypothetical protein